MCPGTWEAAQAAGQVLQRLPAVRTTGWSRPSQQLTRHVQPPEPACCQRPAALGSWSKESEAHMLARRICLLVPRHLQVRHVGCGWMWVQQLKLAKRCQALRWQAAQRPAASQSLQLGIRQRLGRSGRRHPW